MSETEIHLVNSQISLLEGTNYMPRQIEYNLPQDMTFLEFDKVYTTYDYSRFNMIKTNRDLNQKNRAKILKSCKKKQLYRPINVSIQDNVLYIVDGQHRFSVWKELGQPIYFIVNPDYSEFEMKEMNLSGVVWNKATFLDSYIKAEKEPYLVFESLMEQTNFSIDLLLNIFAHFQNKIIEQIHDDFRDGTLTLDKLEDIEEFIFFHRKFLDYPNYKKSNFIKALMKIYENNDVDREHLLKQYERHRRNLKTLRVGSIRKYIGTMMNDVYCVQTPKSKSLYYNVEKGRFHN
ncbi:hypothetical protein ABEX78_33405 [Priestia megaterium]